jgi:hypothetical protein
LTFLSFSGIMSLLLYIEDVEMFAFPAGPRPYYSPNHTHPAQDVASVAAHADEMAALRSIIETPVVNTDYTEAQADFDGHLGLIDLVQRGTRGVLSAMQDALANRLDAGEPLAATAIKPDVIYTNDAIYVRKQR